MGDGLFNRTPPRIEREKSFLQNCSNAPTNRRTGPRGGRSIAATVKRPIKFKPVDDDGHCRAFADGVRMLRKPEEDVTPSLAFSYVPGRSAPFKVAPNENCQSGR